MSAAVVPGMRLGSISEYASGEGTYISGNDVFAAVAGFQHVTEPEQISTVRPPKPSILVSMERKNNFYCISYPNIGISKASSAAEASRVRGASAAKAQYCSCDE
jgi:exosome complex RNA-binding protein Csl4